jgi:hypothetical protein
VADPGGDGGSDGGVASTVGVAPASLAPAARAIFFFGSVATIEDARPFEERQ